VADPGAYTKEELATLHSQIVSNLEQAWEITGRSEDELTAVMVQISQVVAKQFRTGRDKDLQDFSLQAAIRQSDVQPATVDPLRTFGRLDYRKIDSRLSIRVSLPCTNSNTRR